MIKRNAHAKINWTLDILGTTENGYHKMDMVMQCLSLSDPMTFEKREDGSVTLDILGSSLAADDTNLVIRAAKTLQEWAHVPYGAHITMEKRIPMGAGLGGGSADAACAIHALCQLWEIDMSFSDKCMLGAKLGADVPYCLYGHPARVGGIGELIEPITMLRTYPMVLVQPCEALSTKEAFRHYDNTLGIPSPDTDACVAAFWAGDTASIAASSRNVMQHASTLLRPRMAACIDAMKETGAFLAQMTGSGSVVFAAYETDEAADAAYETLKALYPTCIRTETVL